MNFISLSFAVFFAVILVCLKLVKNKTGQHLILLLASYLFYSLFDWRFLALLAGMSGAMWLLGKLIDGQKTKGQTGRLPLTVGVILALVVLGFFKYYNFFVESFQQAFQLELHTLSILLPVGISFYTFQAISYICDVYRGKVAPAGLLQVLLYIGFFPQIVSGPIVKAHHFLPQLGKPVVITGKNLEAGLQRFLIGVFKKLVIADCLGVCVNAVFSAPKAYSGLSLLFAVVAYAMQIYCDFSGYSSMAIGVAQCMGFDLGINFNMPYLAENPSDFWRRWHISLSSWFRDYVYIPLGGNRKGPVRTYLNLFLTMLLSGLWHGASWTFVIWGAAHGLWSAAHKLLCRGKEEEANGIGLRLIRSFLCLAMVSALWVVFRADTLANAWVIISRILTMADGVRYYYVFVPIYGAVIFGSHLYAMVKNNGNDPVQSLDTRNFSSKLILCLFALIIFFFGYFGESAFIYAQF